MFWKEKHQKSKIMRLFNMFIKFLNAISDLGLSMVKHENSTFYKIIDRIKLFYYVEWKYPRLIKYAQELFYKYIKVLNKEPNQIIPICIEYVEFLLIYSATAQMDTKDVLNMIFPNKELEIHTNIDNEKDDSKVIMTKLTIISRTKETFDNFKDKYTITKANIDLDSMTCELTQTVYDCEDEFHAKTAEMIRYKFIKINENGNLVNPNYLLDEALRLEDTNSYLYMITHTVKMLNIMVLYLIDLKVSVKLLFEKNDVISS